MYTGCFGELTLAVNFLGGCIHSVRLKGIERRSDRMPLFRVGLRDRDGNAFTVKADDAILCSESGGEAIYTGFRSCVCGEALSAMSVGVRLADENGEAAWRISVCVANDAFLAEWVDFPLISLPPLTANNREGTGGELLFPYNEGVLISDVNAREETGVRYHEPEYPSM